MLTRAASSTNPSHPLLAKRHQSADPSLLENGPSRRAAEPLLTLVLEAAGSEAFLGHESPSDFCLDDSVLYLETPWRDRIRKANFPLM